MTRPMTGFQLAAWAVIATLVLLSIVPPTGRPDFGAPHHLEHFLSFFAAGMLFYLGYPFRLLSCLVLAVIFAAGIESLQMLVPGRHARLSDFALDASGAWVGAVVGVPV